MVRETKAEASKALESLFLQLSLFADKEKLTLTMFGSLRMVLMQSTFRSDVSDPDLANP